tara:strand:- start:1476 stop:1883 length:408 start_codon:yes stop_codon:yes gene_type:complete
VEAYLVPPSDVTKLWGKVEPLITKALKHNHGELISSDILKLLLQRRQLLWIGFEDNDINSALIGEFITYPRKKAFRIITWSTKSGYHYEEWMKLFDKIEDFARVNGCSLMEAWTRKGLAKKLNWNHSYSIVSKQL